MPASVVAFTPVYLLAFHILFHIVLALNSAPIRRVMFVPLSAILLYLLLRTSTGHLAQNWLTGHMLVIELLTASDYLLVTVDVHKDLRQSAILAISEASFSDRLKWALKLTLNPRGIGWLHEPSHALPPKPTASRSSFMISQGIHLAFHTILLLAVGRAITSVPTLQRGSHGMGSSGWSLRLLSVFLLGTSLYTSACLRGCIFRLLFVGLKVWQPEECPYLFDSVQHAYTVRNFWGKFWHQILRRLLLSHARAFAHRVALLRPGSVMSAYVQLFVAFFLSGVIHHLGQYMLTRDYLNPFSRGPLIFFLAQAVVITLEDIVIALGRKVGLKSKGWKVLGFIWVLAWFTLSVPVWMDQQIAAGFMDAKFKGGMSLKFVALGDLYLDM
ncbi:membrane bound O-acyl transferase family-domain-containing protein [Mycena metata]|uniref:Membrane bound O-acyl transferase family-domain-containing protein n=1 Tax=Mycena metata TaxID=1033252 RepID=A0AAD7J8E9_9AGAR|nr:membrane bound O-acyl transferase family-domain-containing protein [Mycena metata]